MKKLTCLISAFLISVNLLGQIEVHQITDFFKLSFYPKDGSYGFYADADSLTNSELEDFGKNMYAFSQYLYTNYTEAGIRENRKEIEQALPDTVKAVKIFNKHLERDNEFSQLYFDFLEKKEIPSIHIDSLIDITCRFYYLHRLPNGRIVMHICAGINEVKELPQNKFTPYYNAFSYSVIRNCESEEVEWLSSFESDLVYTADSKISDAELERLKNKNYEILKLSEDFKKNIIKEYIRRSQFLNFKLIYN